MKDHFQTEDTLNKKEVEGSATENLKCYFAQPENFTTYFGYFFIFFREINKVKNIAGLKLLLVFSCLPSLHTSLHQWTCMQAANYLHTVLQQKGQTSFQNIMAWCLYIYILPS